MFHLAFIIGSLVHNFTESSLFVSNSVLVTGFLLATFDLQQWRIKTQRPDSPRYPNPARSRGVQAADGQRRRLKYCSA